MQSVSKENDRTRYPELQMRDSATPWSPLRNPMFRALWIAGVFSNIGSWIHITATAWLMTSLAPSAVMVSLVQTASSLPIFLLALPAGALADVLDRRRLILVTQACMLLAAAALGVLTILGLTTPWTLLALTLVLGAAAATNMPAWQAIIPELVSRAEIPSAVALNSVGFNAARAIGPAVGGLVVGLAGTGFAFMINALSFLGVMIVLFFWKRRPHTSTLPAERIVGAMRTGLRYVRHAPALRAVFVRATAFIVCASALAALLPLYARQMLGLGSVGYGLLLGAFGFGAVAGAAVLPAVRRRTSLDRLNVLTNLAFAAALALMAFVHEFYTVCAALTIAGGAWLALLASFNSSVQSIVPAWVRGRALAVYMLVFFGGMAGGSVVWGVAASFSSIPTALNLAALGLASGIVLTRSQRLRAPETLDLSPSMHWSVPTLVIEPRPEDGPVLITIEYRVDPRKDAQFRLVMDRLRRSRLRGGAFRWRLFVDASDCGRYLESFIVESWIEHLRQHERLTVADLEIEQRVRAFHCGDKPPIITHLVARPVP